MSCHCYFVPKYIEDRVYSKHLDKNQKALSVSSKFLHEHNSLKTSKVWKDSTFPIKNHVYTAKNRRRSPGILAAASMNQAVATKDINVVTAWILTDYFIRFCNTVLLDKTSGLESLKGANLIKFNGDLNHSEVFDIKSTIHYYMKYNNALYDGEQVIYGDGDGIVFEDFAQDPSVVFHSLWHIITERSCKLLHKDQSGSLLMSLFDIFASIIMQWMNGETVDEASWLIGERCIIDNSEQGGRYALRSMSDPGTAFIDHPYMGTDDQRQDMSKYDISSEDSVYKNSGIPNHVFYLFAKSIGGYSWNIPCKIWFETITTPGLISPNSTFVEFAQSTISVATDLYGTSDRSIVDKLSNVWQLVKVL